jgi:hypothetical protein
MILLSVCQVLCSRYFYEKYKGKWDPILILLKLIVPIYMFYIIIWNLECLNWENTIFSICICLGIVFIHNNQN